MAQTQTVSQRGLRLAMRDTRVFVMLLFSMPAIITYFLFMPLFCSWQGLTNFSHIFAAIILGVMPVVLTMLAAWALMFSNWQAMTHYTIWDWLSFAVTVTIAQWLLFMGMVSLSLLILPAGIMDQIAGAFYFYMVPLCGINWLALATNMLMASWAHNRVVSPAIARHAHKSVHRHSKPVVLAVWPASFIIYGLFQFLFYHFVPA